MRSGFAMGVKWAEKLGENMDGWIFGKLLTKASKSRTIYISLLAKTYFKQDGVKI